MNNYFTFFNKNNGTIAKTAKNKKRLVVPAVALALICLLISSPAIISSVIAVGDEPSLAEILGDLGYTNISLSDVQTFPAGIYNATLLAEFAGYHDKNVLGYYLVETTNYPTIFSGPEGATGDLSGFVVPSVSKIFQVDGQFGITMQAPEHRYFTQHALNPDYPQEHAEVYVNLDVPGMYMIGFENYFGGFDRDYNDMIFSMIAVNPLQIVSVSRSPDVPNYDESVTVTAQVASGDCDVASVVLSYQLNSGSWTNVTMSLDSGVYVVDIPAQIYGTAVNYRVYASDLIGYSVVSSLYSYVVGDFVAPVISDVAQVPATPEPEEQVTVSATVTEPPQASGIKNVTLWYTNDTVWYSLGMALQEGKWTATISGQTSEITVNYFIEAFDNTENRTQTSTLSYIVGVPNVSPIANFVASPSNAYSGQIVTFDASASYDSDGIIVSYSWYFGDGNVATGVSASHSYAAVGTYSVTLTVTDDDGATDSKTAYVVVENRLPVAIVSASATTVGKGQTISFDASSSYDVDGTIVSYFWDFGDGIYATGVTAIHSYISAGQYVVILTVTDDDGAIDTASVTIIVRNVAPVAQFTESSKTVYVNDEVTFDASTSYDPDGTIVSYVWDFGDGTTATGVIVSHTYPENGFYVVTLTVTDNDGATNSVSLTKVAMNNQPVALFTLAPDTINTGEHVAFDASASYDPDGTIVSYLWKFGDGTKGTGVTADHVFNGNGAYTVTLIVTDDDGATGSTTSIVTVLNISPVAAFTENTTSVSENEAIAFDASGSYDPDGTIVSYYWKFGDGTTATGVSIAHAYSQDGTYTVSLTVTDDDGKTDATTATMAVLNKAPVASFTESAEVTTTGDNIAFDASGSYDPDGTIVSYYWNFGDGNSATGITVNYAFDHRGTYTVTLTVTDNNGATDSETKTITISNRQPIASFTANTTEVIENNAVSFDASASYDPDGTIVSYVWNFGDGTATTGVTAEHVYTSEGEYPVTLTVTDNDGDSVSETENIIVNAESVVQLAILSVIGLGIATLTMTLLYGLFIRRRNKKKNEEE